MKKILITINANTLIFKERKKLNTEYKNIINTNVISCNELLFSDEYILSNTKIVATFINELSKNFGIDTAIIEDTAFCLLILSILKDNKDITSLILKDDTPLTFKICESVVKTNIKSINCSTLQPFMIEYLDKYGVLVESRNEILFLSKFMLQNNLSLFSSLFYKVTLQIDFPMSKQDEEDFLAFAKINKYLKTINVNTVNKSDLEYIVTTLKKTNKKNIRIVIRDNINDPETINYLREYNKKKSKRYKIYFRLVYSNDYLKENLIKQTNSSLLQTCGVIILVIITFSFGYVFYDNYVSMKKVNDIKDTLSAIILESQNKLEDKITEEIVPPTNEDIPTEDVTSDAPKEEIEPEKVEEKITDLSALFNINPDVVGWLTVNNTNIDYPVVQSVDNEYYLKHNFYMEKDNNGWVFMDYRNNTNEINDNTLIYAHNRYYSGIMFGTLQNTLRKSWYTNPDNQIITLKTLDSELHYQIFSIYKIAVTTDYLRTIFGNDEKIDFYNMLKDRSIYNFGIELKNDDKILTLSTCADEENRYVLHAVLIKETS